MVGHMILALLGLAGLVFGSSIAVKGAMNLATRWRVSPMVVGLTITSIGTSIPEIATNLTAAVTSATGTDASGIAMGNIVGSNLSQITLLLGVTAMFATITVPKRALLRDGGMLIVALIAMFLACLDGEVARWEGGVLILLFALYFYVRSLAIG